MRAGPGDRGAGDGSATPQCQRTWGSGARRAPLVGWRWTQHTDDTRSSSLHSWTRTRWSGSQRALRPWGGEQPPFPGCGFGRSFFCHSRTCLLLSAHRVISEACQPPLVPSYPLLPLMLFLQCLYLTMLLTLGRFPFFKKSAMVGAVIYTFC